MSLRAQVYAAYGLIAAVCLSAVVGAALTQRRLLTNFANAERADRLFAGVLEIDRDVQELQTHTSKYLAAGLASQRRAAERICDSLVGRVAAAAQAAEEPSVRQSLDQMGEHLQTFRRQLTLAGAERDLRTRLMTETLPASAAAVAESLATQIAAAEDEVRVRTLTKILDNFRDAERRLANYLADPRYAEIEEMLRHLDASDAAAESIPTDRLPRLLRDYRRQAIRSVTATRGYLYFSNVVMAGEVSEFGHYSDRLKRHATQRLSQMSARRADEVHYAQTTVLLWAFAAVVAAGILAAQLTRVLTRPLTDLRDTFLSLAAGNTVADIPGTRRSDEVGQMANAAQVFSDKNLETEDLLRQTRRQAEKLDEQAARLRETVEELDNFAYVASHDLKSPLRGISNLAEWIREDCEDSLPEESREFLKEIGNRIARMNCLLDDLLQYSRVGRMQAAPEEVDVARIVEEVRGILDGEAAVRVTTPLPRIRTARAPFQQVLLNLITNASKYNDKGPSGLIEVACEESPADAPPDMIRLSVTDNGVGIEPKNFDRIFQMYQRLSPDQAEGSGMGLAIVKKQVESFGGRISVQSEPGVRTTFAFTWPLHPSASAGRAA